MGGVSGWEAEANGVKQGHRLLLGTAHCLATRCSTSRGADAQPTTQPTQPAARHPVQKATQPKGRVWRGKGCCWPPEKAAAARTSAHTHLQVRHVLVARRVEPLWPLVRQVLDEHAKLGAPVALRTGRTRGDDGGECQHAWRCKEAVALNQHAVLAGPTTTLQAGHNDWWQQTGAPRPAAHNVVEAQHVGAAELEGVGDGVADDGGAAEGRAQHSTAQHSSTGSVRLSRTGMPSSSRVSHMPSSRAGDPRVVPRCLTASAPPALSWPITQPQPSPHRRCPTCISLATLGEEKSTTTRCPAKPAGAHDATPSRSMLQGREGAARGAGP